MKRISIYILVLSLVYSLSFADDTVQGKYCYTYGDKESLAEAKELVHTLTVRNAIESYRAFIVSSSNVKNFTLTNDIIQMISSGYMKNIKTLEQKIEGRTICETIEANVSPQEIDQFIKQEFIKRTAEIETTGIDNNGILKILRIEREWHEGPNEIAIRVYLQILKQIKSYEEVSVMITYFSDGYPFYGDKKILKGKYYPGEIESIGFRTDKSNLFFGKKVTSYKVWLPK